MVRVAFGQRRGWQNGPNLTRECGDRVALDADAIQSAAYDVLLLQFLTKNSATSRSSP